MRKSYTSWGDASEDDWEGKHYRKSASSTSHRGQAMWIIFGVIAIVILYGMLAIFSKHMTNKEIILEQMFIPNSPHSMGEHADEHLDNLPQEKADDKKKPKRMDCKDQWSKDSLVGRCFGLSVHSKFNELGNIEVVESAEECKALCCELGEKCMTWQYWTEYKRCNLGPSVRFGSITFESDLNLDGSSSLWCESEAPVVWRGRRIQSRDGPRCEWGDSLPTQCHGLGAEKRGSDGNRLAKSVCERACCHTASCTVWQQHPDRGCFIGSGENVICESYAGTFIGGRKNPALVPFS